MLLYPFQQLHENIREEIDPTRVFFLVLEKLVFKNIYIFFAYSVSYKEL